MPGFDVYIDRPVDATPSGRSKLAAAMAARFKLPEQQVAAYLATKRLRVKAGLDEPTARKLAGELESLGAVVSIVPASFGSTPPAKPASGVAATMASIAPPPPTPAAKPKFESGLGAAFAASSAPSGDQFGALENAGGMSLASLDGQDDAPPTLSELEAKAKKSPGQDVVGRDPFAPPDEQEEGQLTLVDEPPTAKKAPAPPPPNPTMKPPPAQPLPAPGPRDIFSPPEEQAEAMLLELAEAPAPKPRLVATTAVPPPPAPTPEARLTLAPQAAKPRPAPAPQAAASGSFLDRFRENQRQRILAGCGLALVAGFLVATVVGSSMEKKYDTIRADYAKGGPPATMEAYDSAVEERELTVQHLHSARQHVEVIGAVLWLLVGGGAAYGWFRITSQS